MSLLEVGLGKREGEQPASDLPERSIISKGAGRQGLCLVGVHCEQNDRPGKTRQQRSALRLATKI